MSQALAHRLKKKNELLAKRKARERKLRQERNQLRHQLHATEARAEAAEATAANLRAQLRRQEALTHGIASRPVPTFDASPLSRWLHRLLANRVWRYPMRLGVLYQHAPQAVATEPSPRRWAGPWPTISIVTPSYQQAPFILRTLQSLWSQNYPNLQHGVVDGGSTDGTVAILQQHSAQLSFWQSEPDSGMGDALDKGFRQTQGEIMAWLNSDDILLPGTLHRVAAYFAQHPEIDVVYGHRLLIDEWDQQVGRWVMPPHDRELLRWHDYIPQETLFWRRRVFDRAGGIEPHYKFAVDWDLLLRLQRSGARFHRLPYFLGAFRVHQHQKSQQEISTTGAAECSQLRQRELGADFHPTLLTTKTVRFQAKAMLYDLLLRLHIRL